MGNKSWRITMTHKGALFIPLLQKSTQTMRFLQVNTANHLSNETKGWVATHNVRAMSWYAKRLDLNPIENL